MAAATNVLGLHEIDRTQVAVAGGKGAQLGELSRIEGIRVPAGFCVTTDAFRRILAEAPSVDDPLDRLSRLGRASRARLLDVLGKGDPLMGDALQTMLDRGDFIRSLAAEGPRAAPAGGTPPATIETDRPSSRS